MWELIYYILLEIANMFCIAKFKEGMKKCIFRYILITVVFFAIIATLSTLGFINFDEVAEDFTNSYTMESQK
ncbi:hypothetical protein [Nitrosophilus labii]|uniref:hypothetical protein n=1 Tax=Nitrosophilus labii TaxID=2706014 RepID=UPI0016569526|nr:hypothetical protein [Nitrosophilus labii]